MQKAGIKPMRFSCFMHTLQFTDLIVVILLLFSRVLQTPVRRIALTNLPGLICTSLMCLLPHGLFFRPKETVRPNI